MVSSLIPLALFITAPCILKHLVYAAAKSCILAEYMQKLSPDKCKTHTCVRMYAGMFFENVLHQITHMVKSFPLKSLQR